MKIISPVQIMNFEKNFDNGKRCHEMCCLIKGFRVRVKQKKIDPQVYRQEYNEKKPGKCHDQFLCDG